MGERSHRLALALAAGCLAVVMLAGSSQGDAPRAAGPPSVATGTVRTATTGDDSELRKTIPIGRRPGARKRVVMSLGPDAIGDLRAGDRLDATAAVEVTVCLQPNPRHRSHRDCVGRTYGYDPRVVGELVLGDGPGAVGGASTVSLGRRQLTCTQSQPNRNHHCVLVIPDGSLEIGDASGLPCAPSTCHVNLVLGAGDRRAKPADRLVVGADSGGRAVKGDKGRLNVVRYRPGTQTLPEPLVSEARVRRALPIARQGGEPRTKVVYSVALPNLRLGEQLVVDGRMVAKIGRHPYNVFQTTNLMLSPGRRAPTREGWPQRVADLNGQIAEGNGFNCTQGHSAHDDPCVTRKVGVLEITRDSPKTLYVNMTAGLAAQADFHDRHRRGDAARILDRGYLRVYRYPADRNDSPPPARD